MSWFTNCLKARSRLDRGFKNWRWSRCKTKERNSSYPPQGLVHARRKRSDKKSTQQAHHQEGALGPIRNRKTGQVFHQNRKTVRKIAQNRKLAYPSGPQNQNTRHFECKNQNNDLKSDQNRKTKQKYTAYQTRTEYRFVRPLSLRMGHLGRLEDSYCALRTSPSGSFLACDNLAIYLDQFFKSKSIN